MFSAYAVRRVFFKTRNDYELKILFPFFPVFIYQSVIYQNNTPTIYSMPQTVHDESVFQFNSDLRQYLRVERALLEVV